jgi:hypothetical protein
MVQSSKWRSHESVPASQARLPRGVRGHAPPENFEKNGANLCNLVHFGSLFANFLRHDIYNDYNDNH